MMIAVRLPTRVVSETNRREHWARKAKRAVIIRPD